jgi:hypothetical protein
MALVVLVRSASILRRMVAIWSVRAGLASSF